MKAEAVICGAGIAGIAVAYQLAIIKGLRKVVLIDEGPPLAMTSDKSTECYRNWWPDAGPAMTALSNRSIDLMQDFAAQTDNGISLDPRGYLFLSAETERADAFVRAAHTAAEFGSGPLRRHEANLHTYPLAGAYDAQHRVNGADLLLGPDLILKLFPFLNPHTVAALHTRRCGVLSAQQLGMLMLDQAREHGVVFHRGRLRGIDCHGGQVKSVVVDFKDHSDNIFCPTFINAAGPYLKSVAQLLDTDVPVVCERHCKMTFSDRQHILPRNAPLLLWTDPTPLPWTDNERELLAADPDMAHVLRPFPAGVHGRPIGAGDSVMLYWTYDCPIESPQFPLAFDAEYPEILIRGMSVMLPRLEAYFGHIPKACIDGGYYTKTPDNRPLIGPSPVAGAWLAGAYSGFGIMISMAAGELLSAQICGHTLPDYAQAFAPDRFADPGYQTSLNANTLAGQL